MSLILALVTPAALADCEERSDLMQISEAVAAAEAAYGQMNADRFRAQHQLADARALCLFTALSTEVAASLHRLDGLQAFLDKDMVGPVQSFGAARRVHGSYGFPESVVPPNNRVWEDYIAFDLSRLETQELATQHHGGWMVIDGRRDTLRPTNLPCWIQVFAGSGTMVWSGFVGVGQPMPAEAPVTLVPVAELADPPPEALGQDLPMPPDPGWSARRSGLVAGGGAALAGGLALLGWGTYIYAGDGEHTMKGRPTFDCWDDRCQQGVYYRYVVPLWAGGGVLTLAGAASLAGGVLWLSPAPGGGSVTWWRPF